MDIMLVQHLLVEHPLPKMLRKNGMTWKTIVVTLSKFEDPDGMLM